MAGRAFLAPIYHLYEGSRFVQIHFAPGYRVTRGRELSHCDACSRGLRGSRRRHSGRTEKIRAKLSVAKTFRTTQRAVIFSPYRRHPFLGAVPLFQELLDFLFFLFCCVLKSSLFPVSSTSLRVGAFCFLRSS